MGRRLIENATQGEGTSEGKMRRQIKLTTCRSPKLHPDGNEPDS
jgi:hypothetical protein